jgi:allantoate deiminase
MPRGAGHDAVVMSEIVPVGMLFVRCAGGISHQPAESVATSDVVAAIDVLDRFVDTLANEKLQ